MQQMKRAVKSYFLSLRASSRFGRAAKLRDAGKPLDALKAAREALQILGHPTIVRLNPAEGSVLSCATVLVEELARDTGEPGAQLSDLIDALKYIRLLGPGSEFAEWVPYLEHRVANWKERAA